MKFKKTLYSRWVLCGEHSVLRGGKALAYPLHPFSLNLQYQDLAESFEIQMNDPVHPQSKEIFESLFKKALRLLNKKPKELTGKLLIKNSVPLGVGLGASAVFSAAIVLFCESKSWMTSKNLREFALSLENTVHGESSGLDIHAVLEEKPLLYKKNSKPLSPPIPEINPLLFLSDSGTGKSTSKAIAQVKKLFKKNRNSALALDRQMEEAVDSALQALHSKTKEDLTEKLQHSMGLSEDCFKKWNLITPALGAHIEDLKASGALAAKPTGAGLGGFVVSLWDQPPPKTQHLIPLSLRHTNRI